jgi:fructose-1,6-bisphosphatase/inositol monophosphatase family enzyme
VTEHAFEQSARWGKADNPDGRFPELLIYASGIYVFAKCVCVCLFPSMTTVSLERARKLICALHREIRDAITAARGAHARNFAKISSVTAADTIYHVDKLSEEAIFSWFEAHWPRSWPVELVMEGIEDEELVTFPRGTPRERTLFKCIMDPIDGTRNIMYDKRSAWVLTGLAPQRGASNTLADITVAVMTELPTTKQWRADQISVVRGAGAKGIVAEAFDLRAETKSRFRPKLSSATDFKHGFASLARFFPEGKALTAQIEEALWAELYGSGAKSSPLVFDDQYISTGGQLYELLVGHDRMIGDIRPKVFAKLGIVSSLTCHPYDICTELILREAGGIVEGLDGRPLRNPLDTTSPVAWIGYANPVLARQVRPILRRLIKQFL